MIEENLGYQELLMGSKNIVPLVAKVIAFSKAKNIFNQIKHKNFNRKLHKVSNFSWKNRTPIFLRYMPITWYIVKYGLQANAKDSTFSDI